MLKRVKLVLIYILYSAFYYHTNKQIPEKFFEYMNKLVGLQDEIVNLKSEKDLETDLVIVIFKKDKEVLLNKDRRLKNNIKNQKYNNQHLSRLSHNARNMKDLICLIILVIKDIRDLLQYLINIKRFKIYILLLLYQ